MTIGAAGVGLLTVPGLLDRLDGRTAAAPVHICGAYLDAFGRTDTSPGMWECFDHALVGGDRAQVSVLQFPRDSRGSGTGTARIVTNTPSGRIGVVEVGFDTWVATGITAYECSG